MSNEDFLNKAYSYLNNGRVDLSEEILEELKEKDETPILKNNKGSLLVDIESISKNEDYVDEGIEIFEELKEQSTEINVNYNLANAYYAKFLLNRDNYLTNNEHLLFKAKKLYLEETVHTSPQENPELYINLGNTYDYIGRTIDGLECYEKVLNIRLDSRALVNKGIALYQYSFFTNNPLVILKDAYDCFKLALEDPKLYSDFRNISEKYVGVIEKILNEELINQEINNDLHRFPNDDLEGFMINFCLENKLYLNLCNFCQRCENSIGDTIVIDNMIVENKYELKDDPFLILSSYLNQIKMDYVSARFLLILSQYEDIDLDFITNNVYVTNTLNYEENDIRVQLLKNSFTSLYNILDKIAFFINEYLDLGIKPRDVSFRNLWFYFDENKIKHINEKLSSLNNFGLNALYDIYLDFEFGNNKNYLRKNRNNLTHRFLRISFIKINEDDKTIKEFKDDTIELAKIVKNAIIYLIRFVQIHEQFKHDNINEKHILKLNTSIIKL